MPKSTSLHSLSSFDSFGNLLKYLRRRARLSQRDLSIAVGYSESQISRFESNHRPPDLPTLAARFAPALHIQDEPETVARLWELAAATRGEPAPVSATLSQATGPTSTDAVADVETGRGLRPLNNLPAQLTSFVGREKEMAEIKCLLLDTRLVTLTGVGGTGKTRLALQVVADLLDAFPKGVWLVELASLSNPALLPQTLATLLDLPEVPGYPLLRTIADYLRPQAVLLILDNCEHLIEACAELAEALLRSCPHLKILATSREALGLLGETAFLVPPLSLPRVSEVLADETVTQSEALRLFVERARAVQPDFQATGANAPAIAQICQQLDGLPLAIELAAARVRALSVEQIASRLEDRFRLLAGGNRTALPRHQTLAALIDWSYELLPEMERALLRRLSVFRGGWTLEAAEGVCADGELGAQLVLGLLMRLVDKSLVVIAEQNRAKRYRLLETIQQYAWSKALESGETQAVHAHFYDYYLRLTEVAASKIYGVEKNVWVERLAVEDANLLAALDWAMDRAPDIDLRLSEVLRSLPFLSCDIYLGEGRGRLGRTLELTGVIEPTETRARVLYRAGRIAWEQGDYAGARSLYEESATLFREIGNKGDLAFSLTLLGRMTELVEGPHTAARSFYEESIAMMQEAGDKWRWAVSLTFLGASVAAQGDDEAARSLLEESVALYRESGSNLNLGMPLGSLGYLALRRCDYAAARSFFEEGLTLRPGPSKWGISWILEGFAGLAALEKKPERAAQLYGAAEVMLDSIGARADPIDRLGYDQYVATVHEQLGDAAFVQAWAEGRTMTMEQAVAYALEVDSLSS